MPRKDRIRPDSFTLIVVPHTEKSSFSVRVPFWTIYVGAGLIVAALVFLAFFMVDYQDTTAQLAELRRGGQVDIVRQQALRQTIAGEKQQQENLLTVIDRQAQLVVQKDTTNHEDAARFSDEVSRLQAQIAELEQFKSDIRRIVGLEKSAAAVAPAAAPAATAPANPPTAQATAPAATAQENPPAALAAAPVAIGPLEPLAGERTALNVSNRGSDTRSTSTENVLNTTTDLIENTVPQQKADLEALREEVSARVAKVDSQWSSPEQLNVELSLYDASPRAWPVSGSIQARFGYDARRMDLGAQPYHEGLDIGGPVGTAVRVPQDGVVTAAGWNGSYGLTLEVRHRMGWSTLYAHLASIPVKVGEQVKKGQLIGYIGMTGLTTGPHLHYEIHLNGTPVDPAKYLGK